MAKAPLRIECLGSTVVRGGDAKPVSLLQRRLLAALALRRGASCGVHWLIDALWPDQPPRSARASLHNQVSRLRERIGANVIESTEVGYRSMIGSDVADFESIVARLRNDSSPTGPSLSPAELAEALSWWRGEPYADIEHLVEVAGVAASLRESRRQVQIALARASLRGESPEAAVALAEALVADLPLDEECWGVLIEALVVTGRRGDALSALSRATRQLRERLGVLPGPALREWHRRLVDEPVGLAAVLRAPEPMRLVGRDDLVARVVGLAQAGTSVVISGEDGSGRTSVAREVWRVLRRRNVRSVFVTAEANAATATAVFDDILDELGLPRVAGIDAVSAFVRRITDEARADPLVLVLDDLSHVGPSSVAALEQCLRQPGVSLVATVGLHDEVPHLLADVHVEVIAPLGEQFVRELVRETGVIRGEFSVQQIETVVALAGGNPLLLAHLLHDAIDGEFDRNGNAVVDAVAEPSTFNVSEGLRAAVNRLLEPHASPVRKAVDIAAIIGRSGPMAVWEELASSSGVRGALASGLIEQRHDEFRFRHGALARVRAAALTAGFRHDIQRAFADACRRRGMSVLLYAAHSFDSRALNARAAYDDCMSAGSDASQRGMHRDASIWYARARSVADAHLLHDSHDALRARIRAGDALRLCGDPSHVAELLACAEAALRHGAPDLVTEATYALLQFGGTSQRSLAQQQAMHFAKRAMRVLQDKEQWALIAAATTLTVSLFDDPAQARLDFQRALDLARDPMLRMRILPYAYLTFGHPRDLDRRVETASELLSLAQMMGDPTALFSAHHQHWANALVLGDNEALVRHHEAMEVLVERIGTVGVRWEFLSGLAALHIAQDESMMAEHLAREAHDLLAPVNAPRAAAVLMSQLFAIRRREGRLHELSGLLASVVAQQPVGSLRALYAATLVASDPERAVHEALTAVATLHDDFTWLPAQFVVGEVMVRTQHMAGAAGVLDALEPWQHLHAAPLTCSFGPVRDVVHNLRELLAIVR